MYRLCILQETTTNVSNGMGELLTSSWTVSQLQILIPLAHKQLMSHVQISPPHQCDQLRIAFGNTDPDAQRGQHQPTLHPSNKKVTF